MAQKAKKVCDVCNFNDGETKIVQYISGVKKEMWVCGNCAENVGIQEQLGNKTLEFQTTKELTQTCPACGWSLNDFIENGVVGCSKCYETFYSEIKPIIDKIIIKNKTAANVEIEPQHKISILKWQLEKAIDEERFEEAAHLRDNIAHFENESGDRSIHPKHTPEL
jgi:protein arginine kinase activator